MYFDKPNPFLWKYIYAIMLRHPSHNPLLFLEIAWTHTCLFPELGGKIIGRFEIQSVGYLLY